MSDHEIATPDAGAPVLVVVFDEQLASALEATGRDIIVYPPSAEKIMEHGRRATALHPAAAASDPLAANKVVTAAAEMRKRGAEVKLAAIPEGATNLSERVHDALETAVPSEAAAWTRQVLGEATETVRTELACGLLADLRWVVTVRAGGQAMIDSVSQVLKGTVTKKAVEAAVKKLDEALGEAKAQAQAAARTEGLRAYLGDHAHHLQFNAEGGLRKTPGNVALLLAHHRDLDRDATGLPCLAYDELNQTPVWRRPPPDIVGLPIPESELADHHATYVRSLLIKLAYCDFAEKEVWNGIVAGARVHAFNPVVEYLNGLKWDGKERLSKWLVTYLGAEDTSINAAIGRWWMISAVARAIKPGCKADYMLILVGEQGIKKSTALQALAGDAWYSPGVDSISTKDGPQSLRGKWIVEIGELDAIRGKEETAVKKFLSQPFDVYRPSYGRASITAQRRCVFAGTTNEETFLHDATGGRRFWPVRTAKHDVEGLTRDRDQLWAEAFDAYRKNERWWPDESREEELREIQDGVYVVDSWEEMIKNFLDGKHPQIRVVKDQMPIPNGTPLNEVTTGEILRECFNLEPAKHGHSEQIRVGKIMRRLRWKRCKTGHGERGYVYRRPERESPPDPADPTP